MFQSDDCKEDRIEVTINRRSEKLTYCGKIDFQLLSETNLLLELNTVAHSRGGTFICTAKTLLI
jgi:hypothetical protein